MIDSFAAAGAALISITRVVKGRVTLFSLARSDSDVPSSTTAWATSTARVSAASVLKGTAEACPLPAVLLGTALPKLLKLQCLQTQ